MKKHLLIALIGLLFCSPTGSFAQVRCAQAQMIAEMERNHPGYKASLEAAQAQIVSEASATSATGAMMRTTGTAGPIPIIFHIVLDTNQYISLGGYAGVMERIRSQMVVINNDFNATNADIVNVPSVWTGLIGKFGATFASAHVRPDGAYTAGFDLRIVPAGTTFSTDLDAAKAVKFTSSGGTDAWDTRRYLNVWVCDLRVSGSTALGVTIPQKYLGFASGEWGVVLHYKVFGARTSPSQLFFNNFALGRTLTHELGHFFYLTHIWGDDGGTCTKDDGIGDTPKQAQESTGKPTFPRFDVCTPSGNGIMFMNYLDYTDDTAMCMFTKGQMTVCAAQIASGGTSYDLTTNPHLSDTQVNPPAAAFLAPNPTNGKIYFSYNEFDNSLKTVSVFNMTGQKVIETNERNITSIDLSPYAKGVYFVVAVFEQQTLKQKIILQ